MGADLLGEWRFNETAGTEAKDSSGYDNHGALVNFSVPPGWTNSGMFNNALVFEGDNDRIDCGSNFDLSTAFTIEIWVKPDVYGSLDYIIWRNDDRPGIRMNSNRWLMMVDGNNGNSIYSTSNVATGVWTHLALTFNGAVGKAYVNGVEENSRTDSTYTQGTILRIGGDGNIDRYFHGIIDEVRIYNKALFSAEIQQHYVQGAAEHGIVLK